MSYQDGTLPDDVREACRKWVMSRFHPCIPEPPEIVLAGVATLLLELGYNMGKRPMENEIVATAMPQLPRYLQTALKMALPYAMKQIPELDRFLQNAVNSKSNKEDGK